MKLKLIILFIIIFIILSNNLFPANFEFAFGGGAGSSLEFSYVEDEYDEGGSRIEDGVSASAFLDIGANFDMPNSGALSSVSVLFETGYNYYMRVRTRNENIPDYKHRFFYHNLIFGIMPKLNFDYGISLGIGAGFFLPVYSESSKGMYEGNLGLASYTSVKEFDFEKILHMYKVPIMPYIKLNLEKNFYMSEKWAFKIGVNFLYNFGMELDMDKLKSELSWSYGYNKYNFSSLSFELFFGFGFGRPK